jgi:death on curing protein
LKHLSVERVLRLYRRLMEATGGSAGLRDRAALESAMAQPRMTFGGEELYPTAVEKAAALGFSLIKNHPFVDGNKRIGFAAMDAFLRLNGLRIVGSVDEQEAAILRLAAGETGREEFTDWLRGHVAAMDVPPPRPGSADA